ARDRWRRSRNGSIQPTRKLHVYSIRSTFAPIGGALMATYWELLQHPNWQRKRLHILERAAFSCEHCDDDQKTLHVHHSYYEKGLKPWEYPDESLHALCVDCHKAQQDQMVLLHRQIGKVGLANAERLYGYALALEAHEYPNVVL